MNATPPLAVESGPVWIDLGTHDLDSAILFYTTLLGWQFEEGRPEFGGYRIVFKDGLPIGEAMTTLMGPDGSTTEPSESHRLDRIPAHRRHRTEVEKAVEHGGQVMVPAMAIGDLGSMAIIIDPAGAVVGAWQPETLDGTADSRRVGTLCWFENMTMDFDAASAFYRNVFSWDLQTAPIEQETAPDVRHLTYGSGDRGAAGLCEATTVLPEGAASYWRVYFGVSNMDESLETLVWLGGAVVDPGGKTPFGRFATVADP